MTTAAIVLFVVLVLSSLLAWREPRKAHLAGFFAAILVGVSLAWFAVHADLRGRASFEWVGFLRPDRHWSLDPFDLCLGLGLWVVLCASLFGPPRHIAAALALHGLGLLALAAHDLQGVAETQVALVVAVCALARPPRWVTAFALVGAASWAACSAANLPVPTAVGGCAIWLAWVLLAWRDEVPRWASALLAMVALDAATRATRAEGLASDAPALFAAASILALGWKARAHWTFLALSVVTAAGLVSPWAVLHDASGGWLTTSMWCAAWSWSSTVGCGRRAAVLRTAVCIGAWMVWSAPGPQARFSIYEAARHELHSMVRHALDRRHPTSIIHDRPEIGP